MKQSFSLILSALLLISTIGFTFNVQTCLMSNQSKITLQASNDCCASSTMPKGCCKNESRTIKLAVDYTSTSVSQLPSLTQHFISILFRESENLFAGNQIAAGLNVCNPHGPPGSPPQGYYILFRTILI